MTKKILTWRDYPRKKDVMTIVGFAPSTRHLTPWDNPDTEFFGVNEEYNYDWFKNMENARWFQIHPRWDYTRTNNMNHYNHPNWLFNREAPCIRCSGEGFLVNSATQEKSKCPECENGVYKPPAYRKDLVIYMQEHWDDIPNSVAWPLDEATKLMPLGYPYFMSSCSMMLILGYMMGYKRAELYGFEMGTMTEYHYQKANFEYTVGWLQGKGMEIYVPKESTLLKGELYGFKNMKTGFRQNLEMRKTILEGQEKQAHQNYLIITGETQGLQKLIASGHTELQPELVTKTAEYAQVIGQHNVIKGALAETNNLINLYDNYFLLGASGDEQSMEKFAQYTNAKYT